MGKRNLEGFVFIEGFIFIEDWRLTLVRHK